MKRFTLVTITIWMIFSLFCCKKDNSIPENEHSVTHITVLYTNDEHGWMLPEGDYGGASGLMYKWKKNEGYDGSDNYLILSGGDMWSGPSISTWFQGESMVEVMNAMHYDAAAIGNHEFDFTVDVLEQRLSELTFPLLASNIIETSTNEIPDFAQPYIIKEIDGVKVGIIGLASLSTPTSTFPTNVKDYQFTNYAQAVQKYAREAKENGATVLILIGHICSSDMNSLVSVAASNGICLIGGAHCHEWYTNISNGVVLIEASSYMKAYGKVEFDYNKDDATTSNFEYKIVENTGVGADDSIQSIVNYWKTKTDSELSEQIAYTGTIINQTSAEMRNMVCDSWLHKFADADVALTNGGGIRQTIPSGAITLSTIVGLLPFENDIIKLKLTGKQLKVMALANDICMGGMTTIGGFHLSNGTEITDETIYTVLTIDYLYARSDYNFSTYDPNPVYTYTNYREPLIDWMKSINTSSANPLSNYLDYISRR
ncbi:MAG: bifunctional UDP-sugar hydrolase/5'-nucleotidase [Bacteroidales bacterium]|jgi:2',3'-cyclic-nucleotide 2'-phosphodiesterase (5'-nucleotidase family)|nr:bifunctional UDP-sugar hydrolase/5'-nucleotidase [Bacteroidales bacterium]